MKVNSFDLSKIFIYESDNKIIEMPSNYYEALYKSRDLSGDLYEASDRYCDLEINNLIKVNANHIASNIAKNNAFVVLDKDRNRVYTYETKYFLYLPVSMVEKIETQEATQEIHKGEKGIMLHKVITFKSDIVAVKDSNYLFTKTFLEAKNLTPNLENIKSIREKIDDLKTAKSLFKDKEKAKAKREKNILFLTDLLKADFNYMVFNYRGVKRLVNTLKCFSPIDHYEKTPEFIEAEKITDLMNKCVFNNNKLYVSNILEMLNYLNISIK